MTIWSLYKYNQRYTLSEVEVINDDEFLKDRQRCENAIFTDIKQTKWTDTINGQRRETDTLQTNEKVMWEKLGGKIIKTQKGHRRMQELYFPEKGKNRRN